jgi:hypothetical protein
MNEEQMNSQPQPPMQETTEPKKGAPLYLFIFAVIVLLVIALLWIKSKPQPQMIEEVFIPNEQVVVPQTNEDITTELITIEEELGAIDSETTVQAL